jgi:myosin heavy subunit
MKRRRHTLQVSTFPFLAVLLCAMGSLILLLLVLDRRAKVVARAKSREHQAALLAKRDEMESNRQFEFEKRKEEMRIRLDEEEAALRAQVDQARQRLEKTNAEIRQEKERTREFQSRLAALRKQLAQEQGEEQEQEQNAAALIAQQKTVLSEQEALSRQVRELEKALADLIAFRKRQAETYSLVPFFGKHGDNRRPLDYLECQADKVIVHPDIQPER